MNVSNNSNILKMKSLERSESSTIKTPKFSNLSLINHNLKNICPLKTLNKVSQRQKNFEGLIQH